MTTRRGFLGALIAAPVAASADAEPKTSEPRIEIRCTCDAMPNQFEGTVNGHPFYFRARHGSWRLQINHDPNGRGIDGTEVASGDDRMAGWWEVPEAETFCRQLLSMPRVGFP